MEKIKNALTKQKIRLTVIMSISIAIVLFLLNFQYSIYSMRFSEVIITLISECALFIVDFAEVWGELMYAISKHYIIVITLILAFFNAKEIYKLKVCELNLEKEIKKESKSHDDFEETKETSE